MHILAVIHGATVRSGVFGEVSAAGGHELEEWSLAWGTPPPRPIDDYGAVFIFGGAMHADQDDHHPWLRDENFFIQRLLDLHVPVLGVCLGAQLIANVLGARVYPGERREVGWAPITLTDDGRDDAVFGLMEPTLTVFHMHGDTYELPPDARNLARSALYEQQAFRYGDLVYGLQFHLEFTDTMIQRLATEAESRTYITEAGVDPRSLLPEAANHTRRLGAVVQKVFSEFFSQCGL